MHTETERRRVRQILQRAGVAMLVTLDGRGAHAGRPMLPLFLRNDPHIYFLTHQGSRTVAHVADDPHVAVTLISGRRQFVVLGFAYAVRDREVIRCLWRPSYRAWFPAGKDDRDATALRIVIDRVNYWEPPRSRVVRAYEAVKAVITRRVAGTPMKTVDGL